MGEPAKVRQPAQIEKSSNGNITQSKPQPNTNKDIASDDESEQEVDVNDDIIEEFIRGWLYEVDEDICDEQANKEFLMELRKLFIDSNTSLLTMTKTLQLLFEHGKITERISVKKLLSTKKIECSIYQNTHEYYTFDIEEEIKHQLSRYPSHQLNEVQTITLDLNIDGVNPSKNSNYSFWPLSAKIITFDQDSAVFPLVVIGGPGKPKGIGYLEESINSLNHLISDGFIFNGKKYKVEIESIIADIPAKGFLKGIKCKGYFFCPDCEIPGESSKPRPKDRSRVTYLSVQKFKKRTDKQFRENKYDNHITREPEENTILKLKGLDMVTSFPWCEMHLLPIGMHKKTLTSLLDRNRWTPSQKISFENVEVLSGRLKRIRLPKEFQRGSAKLRDWRSLKATQHRSWLLYFGPLILKDVIQEDQLLHYQVLSCICTILYSPGLKQYVDDLDNYIDWYIKQGIILYGKGWASANVHGFTHILENYRRYGKLKGAWDFENFFGMLMRRLRSGHLRLHQLVNRYQEMRDQQQPIEEVTVDPVTVSGYGVLKIANIPEPFPVKILSRAGTNFKLRIFKSCEPVFKSPMDSRLLNQFLLSSSSEVIELTRESFTFIPCLFFNFDVERKCVIPFCHYNKIL